MLLCWGIAACFAISAPPWVGDCVAACRCPDAAGQDTFYGRGLSLVRDPLAASSTHPAVGLKCLFATLTLVSVAYLLLAWGCVRILPRPVTRRIHGWKFLAVNTGSSTAAESARHIKPWVPLVFGIAGGILHACFGCLRKSSGGGFLIGWFPGPWPGC